MDIRLNQLRALMEALGPKDRGDPRGDGATPGSALIEFTDSPIAIGNDQRVHGVVAKVTYEVGVKNEATTYLYLLVGSSVVKI
jgi:hypothetical protein